MDWFVNLNADSMSPIGLFLQADWVVKGVMIGLLLASIWTWGIIFSLRGRIAKARISFSLVFSTPAATSARTWREDDDYWPDPWRVACTIV